MIRRFPTILILLLITPSVYAHTELDKKKCLLLGQGLAQNSPLFGLTEMRPIMDLGAGGSAFVLYVEAKDRNGKLGRYVVKFADPGREQFLIDEYDKWLKHHPDQIGLITYKKRVGLVFNYIPEAPGSEKPAPDLAKFCKAEENKDLKKSDIDSLERTTLDDLEEIHKKGDAFGDVRGANILAFRNEGGELVGKFIDYQLVTPDGRHQPFGTTGIWSPERMRSWNASIRDDLYALGREFLNLEVPGVFYNKKYMRRTVRMHRVIYRIPEDIPGISAERMMTHVTLLKDSVATYKELLKLADTDPASYQKKYAEMWAKEYTESTDKDHKVNLVCELFMAPGLGPKLFSNITDPKLRIEILQTARKPLTHTDPYDFTPDMDLAPFFGNPLVMRDPDPRVQSVVKGFFRQKLQDEARRQ